MISTHHGCQRGLPLAISPSSPRREGVPLFHCKSRSAATRHVKPRKARPYRVERWRLAFLRQNEELAHHRHTLKREPCSQRLLAVLRGLMRALDDKCRRRRQKIKHVQSRALPGVAWVTLPSLKQRAKSARAAFALLKSKPQPTVAPAKISTARKTGSTAAKAVKRGDLQCRL